MRIAGNEIFTRLFFDTRRVGPKNFSSRFPEAEFNCDYPAEARVKLP